MIMKQEEVLIRDGYDNDAVVFMLNSGVPAEMRFE